MRDIFSVRWPYLPHAKAPVMYGEFLVDFEVSLEDSFDGVYISIVDIYD